MQACFDVGAVAPEGFQAMYGVHQYVDHSGLPLRLLELLRLRVAAEWLRLCLAMHTPLGAATA